MVQPRGSEPIAESQKTLTLLTTPDPSDQVADLLLTDRRGTCILKLKHFERQLRVSPMLSIGSPNKT
jgi:hypothetical protein